MVNRDDAVRECRKDNQCGGFYDVCGKGRTFKLCGTPLQEAGDVCGSILYIIRK